jgi:hypothetical protein
MPNLNFPCWRARWDDRIGHLDHPIRTRVLQKLQAGRPGTFAEHILPCHKTTRDPPMDPYELGTKANTKVMTERPSTSIKWAIFSTCRDLLDRNTTMDLIHMLISKPVKWRAEMCQLQAGRPTIFSFEPMQPTPTSGGDQERPREGRRPTEEITGRPAPLCSVSSSSSCGSYVNRPSCVHPTPRPNTDL